MEDFFDSKFITTIFLLKFVKRYEIIFLCVIIECGKLNNVFYSNEREAFIFKESIII